MKLTHAFAVSFVLLVSCSGGGEKPVTDMNGPSDASLDAMSNPDMTAPGPDGAVSPDMTTMPDMTALPDLASDLGSDMGPDMRVDPDMGVTMLPAGTCGNNIVEIGETCDDCSALSCDDGNACTVDFIAGDATLCLAYCRNDLVSACISGDGCCPSGCAAAADSDCSTTCGDDVVDGLETCDGDCPATCDDQDPATRDVMVGSAANCNVECVYHPILRCFDGDGTCPAGCIEATDSDCEPECGNGVIEAGETCDPPGSCTTCDDGNPCTADVVSGSAATCDVSCSSSPITACIDGDGCCGLRCSFGQDNDCSPTCGDGVVQPPETCEGAPSCNSISCNPTACETAIETGHHQSCNVECGYVETTGCTNGDGCCPLGCTAASDNDCNPLCGNGVLEAGEICDPPGLCEIACPDDGDACTTVELLGDPSTCDGRCEVSPVTTCGIADGCCPSNCSANDDPDCTPFCGNSVVEMGEICDGNCPTCDDGNSCTIDTRIGIPSTCNVTCQNDVITFCGNADGCCPQGVGCTSLTDVDCAPVCGNFLVENGETCDGNCPTDCSDGNVCTSDVIQGSAGTCDFSCSNPAITACTADGCCAPGCNANNDPDCSPICGNNVTESGETCDGNCPTACNDGNACTTDQLVGSSGQCTAECRTTNITTCTNGDGCCPSVCSSLNDTDCP